MLTEAEQKELDGLRQVLAQAGIDDESDTTKDFWWQPACVARMIDLERRDASQRMVKSEPTIADPTLERKTHATDPERRYDVRRNCIPIIVDEAEPTLERIPNLRTCGVARADGR